MGANYSKLQWDLMYIYIYIYLFIYLLFFSFFERTSRGWSWTTRNWDVDDQKVVVLYQKFWICMRRLGITSRPPHPGRFCLDGVVRCL